jgi:hypothetical protein
MGHGAAKYGKILITNHRTIIPYRIIIRQTRKKGDSLDTMIIFLIGAGTRITAGKGTSRHTVRVMADTSNQGQSGGRE